MAEEIILENNQEEQDLLLRPVFGEKKKKRSGGYKSDIGMLVSYNPEKSLRIRVPAASWDDENQFPNCTPLNYVQKHLEKKIQDLNNSDEEIKIEDFFKIKDSSERLIILETGVTPISATPVVYEAINYLMNDKEEGMNCQESPSYRANIRINKEKFTKKGTEMVPLNLGQFFGFISYEPGRKVHVRYDFNTPNGVPYNTRIKFSSSVDCKRMNNNTGFYSGIEFRKEFYVIAFNKRDDGKWEIYTLYSDNAGNTNRFFAEEDDFIEGLKNHQSKVLQNEKTADEFSRIIKTAERIVKASIENEEILEDDDIFVSSGEIPPTSKKAAKKKGKKAADEEEEVTMSIGEMVAPDSTEEFA